MCSSPCWLKFFFVFFKIRRVSVFKLMDFWTLATSKISLHHHWNQKEYCVCKKLCWNWALMVSFYFLFKDIGILVFFSVVDKCVENVCIKQITLRQADTLCIFFFSVFQPWIFLIHVIGGPCRKKYVWVGNPLHHFLFSAEFSGELTKICSFKLCAWILSDN